MSVLSDANQFRLREQQHTVDKIQQVPATLARATLRLDFPPSYVIVGVYRLFTDKALYVPTWDKCQHAARRGAVVGFFWSLLTFGVQRKFIAIFLMKSQQVTGLSDDTMFGYKIPFSISTYAALLFLGTQVTYILHFFLSRNLRIARERAWEQTVVSRGKGPDFWQPYVEEWDAPPDAATAGRGWDWWMGSWVGKMLFRKVILLPFALNPFVHIALSAALKSLGTARYLHKPYFEAKKMTRQQQAIFIEERKWDYWLFGFAAALLEGIPILGLVFTVSNRIGAAMWAHDLEKRQHFVAEQRHEGVRN